MKNFRGFLCGVALLLLLALTPSPGFAQAVLASTTLGAAVTSASATTITVASATGITANTTFLFIDREYLAVRAVSGTVISVLRGFGGIATTHANGATVYRGPANNFTSNDRAGSCTSTNEIVLPIININTGIRYDCVSSLWAIIGGPTNAGLTLTAPTLATPVLTSVTQRKRYCTVPVGSVAYASFGTSTTPSATLTYYADVEIPATMTVTGISVLNAATVGTNTYVVALHTSAGGAGVANSALAGVLTSGANAFQDVPFTATYSAAGPARYWVALQVNGITDRFRTVAASTFPDVLTKSAASTFGTIASLTVPTTFTADVGPLACLY